MEKGNTRQEKKMTDTDNPDYIIVDNEAELEEAARYIEVADTIGVDIEADSLFHFCERVCLVQIRANGKCFLIDPLAVSDLSPLKPVFADDKVLKILHGSDFDVRSLYRDFGIKINNLFDTEIAARFLGERESGLDTILTKRFGVKLDKRYQRKDWTKRPLPDEMLNYAARDTLYLIELAEQLTEELEEKNRLEWVQEESTLLSMVRPPEANGDPLFFRFRGAGTLAGRELATLEELLKMRVSMARKMDLPLFKVIGNKPLLSLAFAMPQTRSEIERVRVLSEKQINRFCREILKSVENAFKIAENALPIYPRKKPRPFPSRAPKRLTAIKEWRDAKAVELNLDPSIVLTKALISAFAAKNPLTQTKLSEIEDLKNWQKNEFGENILSILNDLNTKEKEEKKEKKRRRQRKRKLSS